MEFKTPLTGVTVSREEEQAIHALYLEKFEQFANTLDRQIEGHPPQSTAPITLDHIYGSLREALNDYKDYRLQYALSKDKSMPMRPMPEAAKRILENVQGLWDEQFGGMIVRKALDTVDRAIEDTLGLQTGFEYRA